jgi:undecaprenyl-diphosphatase
LGGSIRAPQPLKVRTSLGMNLARLKQLPVPRFLVPILLAAACAWSFIEIADEVVEGETRAIDEGIILALRTSDPHDPIGPAWFEEAVRDLTALGSTLVLSMAVVTVVGFLLLMRHWRAALFTFAASVGGQLASHLLKEFFGRPRPDLIPHEVAVFTHSFPSGHAMMSAVVYLTLAALAARLMDHRRLKLYAMSVAVAFTVLIGVSRVYLGVHWPSDVLAGWMIGAGWALACWLVAAKIGLGGNGSGTDRQERIS